MGERIRAFDWGKTPIGPIETWSPSLKMMVRFLLANRFPLLLWWGPQFVQIYNDPYRPILGAKHPSPGLGRPLSECWSEIWDVLRPLVETPFNGGPATWMEDILLEVNRHGFTEESHFTVAYSPVPDETVPSGIGGVLATVHEITEKVIGERRGVALRDLGARLSEAKSAKQACEIAAQVLAAHDKDVPFVLFYLIDDDGKHARLQGTSGAPAAGGFSPETINLEAPGQTSWPFAEALRTGSTQVVSHLGNRFANIPQGPWSDAPNTAAILPMPSHQPDKPLGFMVAGVSPRLQFDAFYRDFFELIRTRVSSAISSARAYEEERKRAEALAEIDRAKTAFFSNVSHEFRTPLTLLLGPAEEMLSLGNGTLPHEAAEKLKVIHRNALRLQRLVNTLLDFSRLEAGRVRGSYVETDLTALTADLAGVFRSTMERAGLKFEVNLRPLPSPVFVDRDMWEKIVFNLLSNAFKFTLTGGVKVSLETRGNQAVLVVQDSGIGIPPEELSNIFKRFHRLEGRRGRTQEGTGIGLALVQELVKMHGGTISVQSEPGRGSSFIVELPFGKSHLPADRIETVPAREYVTPTGAAFVEEALTWIPEETHSKASEKQPAHSADAVNRPRIILAEDNADMRFYLHRLLQADYSVQAVPDGAAALEAARRHPPDLILSDVMMPHMNGFELVQAIRTDAKLRGTPIILLSARAGEEARMESASQLADDYLVKPFSARELLARVGVHVKLARARAEAAALIRKSEMRLTLALEGGKMGLWEWNIPANCSIWNATEYELLGLPVGGGTEPTESFFQMIHPEDVSRLRESLEKIVKQGVDWREEFRIIRPDGKRRWLAAVGRVYRDAKGQATAMIGVNYDITEDKSAESRNQFLLSLDDALRPLSDPHQISIRTAQVLGEYLHADRCAYANIEPDADTMNLAGNYVRNPEIKSLVGRLKFSDFGGEILQLMREGKPCVIKDVDTHQPPVRDTAAYRAAQIQALICVPLHKAGRLVAAMAVHIKTARQWKPEEVELVRAVAARCWESLERAKLERGLNESEIRYRSLFESMDEGFCVVEVIFDQDERPVDYRFVEVNPAFKKQTGMQDPVGKRMRDLAPDLEPYWAENFGRVALTGQSVRIVAEHKQLESWFDVYAFRTGSPEERKVALLFTNITEKKLSEDAVRKSEERFRALVTASSDVVYRMNADWSEMHQLKGKDFIADTEGPNRGWLEKYIHPGDQPRVIKAIQEAIRTKSPFALEHRVIRMDGSLGWTFSRAIPVLDSEGEITEWFGAASDITERRHAEEALRDETRVLELLNDTGSAIAAQLDLQTLVQIVTDAATKLCGAKFGAFFYNALNASGEMYLLYTLSGASREAFEKFGMPRNTPIFNPTFTGKGLVRSPDITKDPRYGKMEPHHGMPKGHLPVRSYMAVPVISRNGEVIGGLFFGHPETNVFTERSERILVSIAAQAAIAIDNARLYETAQRDIADRKRITTELQQAKEELSHHAEDLEQQVNARTASLREALSQLEEFSYSVSHDLRAPLRAILGYSRVFREDFGEQLPPDAATYLDKISRSAERMERLVNDVLTLSRVARADLQLRPIPLQQFIEELLEHNPTMQPSMADLTVIAPHTVMGDEARLGQALSNLLYNAVKFVGVGEKPIVRVRSEALGDRVRIWVEDQGIGIPMQNRGKLFGMFQRLTANQFYEGTGIGLAIVRKAVEAMSGKVGMESNEPKGSRFWIELGNGQIREG